MVSELNIFAPKWSKIAGAKKVFLKIKKKSPLRYHVNVFLPPLPVVGRPTFLEIRNPWGKVMKRSGLTFEYFCLEVVQNRRAKKCFFCADFALQNMVETTFSDGLETSG